MQGKRIGLLVTWLLPIVVVAFAGKPSLAKLEFGKKESKACTYCHVKTGSKELNEAGKYYKEHGNSLEGYKEPQKK